MDNVSVEMKVKRIALALMVGLCGALLIVLAMPEHASASAPCEVPSAQVTGTFEIYLPLVCVNSVCYGSTTIYTGTCASQVRGQLYRDLVSNTISIIGPIGEAASEHCCPISEAEAKGLYVGRVLRLIPTIMYQILSAIWIFLSETTGFLMSLIGLQTATPLAYENISCSDGMEPFCFSVAAIAATDDMAGGWITIAVALLIVVLSIYLTIWVVNQVRFILEPASSGGDE